MFNKYAPTLISQLGNQKQNTLDINTTPVTPSDTIDLPNGPTTGLLVKAPGNISANLPGAGTVVFTGVVAGQFFLATVTRILATGTTATVEAGYN